MASKIKVRFAMNLKNGLLVEDYDERGELLHTEVYSYNDIRNYLRLYREFDPEKADNNISRRDGDSVYAMKSIEIKGAKTVWLEKMWPKGFARRYIEKSFFDKFMAEFDLFLQGKDLSN